VHEAKMHVPPAEAQAVPSGAPLDELQAIDIDPRASGNQSQRIAGNYIMSDIACSPCGLASGGKG
jgi:hypothetical protein